MEENKQNYSQLGKYDMSTMSTKIHKKDSWENIFKHGRYTA